MITHLTAVRRDLLENREEIFISGPAIRTENSVSARECAPFSGRDTLEWTADALILTHRGETESRIELPYTGQGEAYASTMFGTMHFTSELTGYDKEEDEIFLRYRLLQDGTAVSEIELEFRFFSEGSEDRRA